MEEICANVVRYKQNVQYALIDVRVVFDQGKEYGTGIIRPYLIWKSAEQ